MWYLVFSLALAVVFAFVVWKAFKDNAVTSHSGGIAPDGSGHEEEQEHGKGKDKDLPSDD